MSDEVPIPCLHCKQCSSLTPVEDLKLGLCEDCVVSNKPETKWWMARLEHLVGCMSFDAAYAQTRDEARARPWEKPA